MKLLATKFNEEKFFLRSQLYARAYVRIWTLRPCCPLFKTGRMINISNEETLKPFQLKKVVRIVWSGYTFTL